MLIKINELEIHIPESWNDLHLKKQLECYAILMTDTTSFLTSQELLPAKRILLLQTLMDIDEGFFEAWKQDCINYYGEEHGETAYLSELSELMQATNFLFEKSENGYAIALKLTKCPFPQLDRKKKTGKIKKLYAPSDGLDNLSLYELGTTFTLFEKGIATQDTVFFDQLIATLYRPPKDPTKENKQSAYQGDIRLPLIDHEGMIKKRLKHIQNLHEPVKQLIVFWFASCRSEIIKAYPNIFNTSDEDEKGGNDYGWGAVIMSLAGSLKDFRATASEKASNALTYLSYLEDERKKAELKARALRV
jgi:hypothetical protein